MAGVLHFEIIIHEKLIGSQMFSHLAISCCLILNGDYSTKKEIYMNALRPVNQEIESWQVLESFRLVKDYEKGVLKGKLKEITAKLDEESNPVIMLIKHKK